jgi:hypothetical protein
MRGNGVVETAPFWGGLSVLICPRVGSVRGSLKRRNVLTRLTPPCICIALTRARQSSCSSVPLPSVLIKQVACMHRLTSVVVLCGTPRIKGSDGVLPTRRSCEKKVPSVGDVTAVWLQHVARSRYYWGNAIYKSAQTTKTLSWTQAQILPECSIRSNAALSTPIAAVVTTIPCVPVPTTLIVSVTVIIASTLAVAVLFAWPFLCAPF